MTSEGDKRVMERGEREGRRKEVNPTELAGPFSQRTSGASWAGRPSLPLRTETGTGTIVRPNRAEIHFLTVVVLCKLDHNGQLGLTLYSIECVQVRKRIKTQKRTGRRRTVRSLGKEKENLRGLERDLDNLQGEGRDATEEGGGLGLLLRALSLLLSLSLSLRLLVAWLRHASFFLLESV